MMQPWSRPEVHSNNSGNRGPTSPADPQARIDQTLALIRQLPTPDGLHARVEAGLTARRLKAATQEALRSNAPLAVLQTFDYAPAAHTWLHWRVAACALAVAAATFGLVADHSSAARGLRSMPTATLRRAHTGLNPSAAVRVPTQVIDAKQQLAGRSTRPRQSGRNTVVQRSVLPQGVAVPLRPEILAPPSAESDKKR